MFGDGKGLNSEVKFAIASAYVEFEKRWGKLGSEKLEWVDAWADLLAKWNVPTINAAVSYCTENLPQPPTLFELNVYCKRVVAKEDLSLPIVSSQEETARQILEFCMASGINYSMIADSCLVAANVARAMENAGSPFPWGESAVEVNVVARARMFGMESLHWQSEAEKGKGYWRDLLNPE